MSMNLGSVYKGPTENNMQSPGGSKFSDERGSAKKVTLSKEFKMFPAPTGAFCRNQEWALYSDWCVSDNSVHWSLRLQRFQERSGIRLAVDESRETHLSQNLWKICGWKKDKKRNHHLRQKPKNQNKKQTIAMRSRRRWLAQVSLPSLPPSFLYGEVETMYVCMAFTTISK